MVERISTQARVVQMPEKEGAGQREPVPAESAVPAKVPAKIPPPANIDPEIVRAEFLFLAGTEPETLLKGLMLECRELVRGSANVICNSQYPELHDNYFGMLKGAVALSAQLAEAVARLRQGGAVEERCQRIVVERIERSLPPPRGEGGAGLLKNE